MSEPTDKTVKTPEKPEASVSAEPVLTQDTIKTLVGLLHKLQSLLMFMQIQEDIEALDAKVDATKVVFGDKPAEAVKTLMGAPKADTMSAVLAELEKNTTVRNDASGKREFLLHRPTENFEYEQSAKDQKTYKTEQATEWSIEFVKATNEREGANPVISCWIPEAKVESIPNAHDNSGTWGELGKNPMASTYRVVVSPGSYEIYQELKS